MLIERVIPMVDVDFRKGFGMRVKEMRKSRKLTQKELAQRLGIHFQLLNKYECGLTLPQPENIVALAKILEVNVDFLLTGRNPENYQLVDIRLMERVQALSHFQKEDQDAIVRMIDAIRVRESVQGTLELIKPKMLEAVAG